MTINVSSEKIVTLIKQTCDAHLPAIRDLQAIVETKHAEAIAEKVAIGNKSVDLVSVLGANQGALSALEWVKTIMDGIVDFKEPTQ